MRMKARAPLAALTVGILLTVAGCGGASTPATSSSSSTTSTSTGAAAASSSAASTSASGGGTLTIAINQSLESLDPLLSGAYIDRAELYGIYDPLVAVTPTGKIVPDLATSWTVSSDGLTYTFQLHPNVKFQDGTDFNAQAVVFSVERAMNDKASPRYASALFIKSVTATGPLTVQFVLKQQFAPFLSLLAGRLGMIVSPAAVKKYGANFAQHPVGTGAFMFKSYVKDDQCVLVKNPNYWQPGLPKVNEVIFKIIPDSNAAVLDLEAGSVQVMDGAPPQDVASLKTNPKVVVSIMPGMAFDGIDMNQTAAPFNNMNLRLALMNAIDRATLVNAVFGQTALPGDTAFPPSSWAYVAHTVPGADPAAVKADLAKGGQPNGFTFTLTTTNTPTSEKMAQVLQSMLASSNITMKIKLIDSAAFSSIVANHNYQAITDGWSGRVDPDQNAYNWYHTGGAFNFGGYSNSQMDSLLEQARASQVQATRKQLYQQVAALANSTAAYIVLYWPEDIKLLLPSVTGFVHYPDGVFRIDTMGL